jgi:sulfopyruvate decarboxylase alpha subunit
MLRSPIGGDALDNALPADTASAAWKDDVFAVLEAAGVDQVHYVPDAGHATLITRAHAHPRMRAVPLTTEEEGVAASVGAWLGGAKAVLLMQSSGVGNCINMLSLVRNCGAPFLTLVTMRGEWAEFNPWQVPMSRATATVLEAMGVAVQRVDRPEDAAETVEAAAALAYGGGQAVAVLFSQRLIGRKVWK